MTRFRLIILGVGKPKNPMVARVVANGKRASEAEILARFQKINTKNWSTQADRWAVLVTLAEEDYIEARHDPSIKFLGLAATYSLEPDGYDPEEPCIF